MAKHFPPDSRPHLSASNDLTLRAAGWIIGSTLAPTWASPWGEQGRIGRIMSERAVGSRRLRLWLLGPCRAERDGQLIPDAAWGRPTARTLVKLLAVQPGHRIHEEEVLDLLWPDLSPRSALGSLRKATMMARHALEPDLPRPAMSSFLLLTNGVLSLKSESVWIDIDWFEQQAEAALSSGDEAAYRQALAAYTDDLLPEDRYEDWTATRREDLAQLRLRLLLGLTDVLERQGAQLEAAGALQQALQQDTGREDLHRRLMRLYVAAGNRQQALRQYQLCRQTLQDELGVEPEPETTTLYEEIVSGRLAPAPAVPSPHATAGTLPPLPAPIRHLQDITLVGRELPLRLLARELERITRPLDADAGRRGGVVLVGGEAGVGKTRLAAEAARIAHQQGAVVLWGGSYEQEGRAPYGPFVEALEGYLRSCSASERTACAASHAQLARLLPGLAADAGAVSERTINPAEEAGRLSLFADVVRMLSNVAVRHPVLLVLDDLHVADEASVQLLHHLARVAPDHPWLILGTYREEDVEAGSAFEQVLMSLTRASLCRHVELLRLSRTDCAALIAHLLPGGTPSDDLLDRIYSLSLGNALFTREIVEAMRDGGIVLRDGSWEGPPAEVGVPTKVRDLIVARIGKLPDPAQAVLALAAAAGMESTFALLRRATTLDEDGLLDACDQVLQARIMEERGACLTFCHPLIRAAIYDRLSHHRRTSLHARLAQAYSAMALDSPAEEYVERIAHHYLLSAPPGAAAPEAAEWLERAGDRAARVYAADAAISHFEAAKERLGGRDERGRARLDEKLGEVLSTAGRYDEAVKALERAAAVERRAGNLEAVGRIVAKLGLAHRWRGTPGEGIAQVQSTIALFADAGSSDVLASLHLALAHLLLLTGRYRETLEATERAGEVARAVGDQALLAEAEERRGVALLLLNRPEEGQQVIEAAIPLIEEAIPLIEARGKLDVLRSALHNAACAAAYLGQVERQRHYAERALRVAERLGNPSQIGFVLANLGHALLILGEWDAARDALDRAVALARSSEHSVNLAYPLTARGVLALQEGEWDTAAHLYEEALTVAEETENRQARDEAERGLAELDLRQGRARQALARLERQAAEDDVDVTVLPILARAFLEAGDVRRAEEVANTAVTRARTQEPLSLVDALWVLGMVRARQGRTEGARDAFGEALRLAARLPSPYLQAQILYEIGWMATQSGESSEGRSRLADALAIFRRLGARWDVERTEQALARFVAV